MINAMVIDKKDNVAVAIEEIKLGDECTYKIENNLFSIKAINKIPIYHKFAIKDISKGEVIIKYGEHIVIASKDIKKGEYVHTHNVEDHRENL